MTIDLEPCTGEVVLTDLVRACTVDQRCFPGCVSDDSEPFEPTIPHGMLRVQRNATVLSTRS